MITRRSFVRQSLVTSTSMLLASMTGISLSHVARAAESRRWQMPDEGAPHAATWMAFGASVAIWEPHLLPVVRKNLALVANTIAAFEPVNMLVREEDHALAAKLCGPSVNLLVHPIDDLWIRDTGPVFVKSPHGMPGGVGFNFNGWGKKQEHDRDAEVAEFVTDYAKAEFIRSTLILEGGGIEVDAEGTAIITESCVLNPNRNPGVSKVECEAELKRLLGLDKIIWLPGIAGKDITDGHTDFYARFTHPGTVVAGLEQDPTSFDYAVTRRHLEILRTATDAKGRHLNVITLEGPSTIRQSYANSDFAAGYINFYLCNDAVIAPEFGDKRTDRNTRDILQEQFTGREIIQLNIDGIAAGGGGIHCATQQQPR
ncbi:agmatine deiminase family protein [Citrobacter youngae]|uniref:agmatine deiminase family protein n=1 Tax=Citrobacter youngae TaxID=133448 RepID=UPI0021506185|nr:agmatine deiminase family protein [Citrobacter youngae]UUX53547.1 agmatine deiminase family protein [Citrobacter youngae]